MSYETDPTERDEELAQGVYDMAECICEWDFPPGDTKLWRIDNPVCPVHGEDALWDNTLMDGLENEPPYPKRDTGPPAPREGEHLPNPEVGMEC